ncbi:MAG: hypothetical protein ACTTJ7_03730 [Treponema sp.]
MHSSIFNDDAIALPPFIKTAATEHLPHFLSSSDTTVFRTHALAIAEVFSAEGSFEKLFTGSSSAITAYQQSLIHSFEKNVRLLVTKTWVDKSGEYLKEDILNRISAFCRSMQASGSDINYPTLLLECIGVLRDIILLLFGEQINQNMFLDYAIRIAPDFGLFWYYIECIGENTNLSAEKARLAIFLGIYFLAHF